MSHLVMKIMRMKIGNIRRYLFQAKIISLVIWIMIMTCFLISG